ncbi:MAG: 3-dehydroquinate synthase [Thermodesulfobacteriota bacterium]|nr:3-dehydroquinate synthase [Thermodesulfobacteriota bacterium]
MEKINVSLADRSYPILIGSDLLRAFGKELSHLKFPQRVAVISNPTVDGFYGQIVQDVLEDSGFSLLRFNVPDGEEFKSFEILQSIYDFLIENNFDRGCGIIALGGGVVGDMAGFAAATFLRGIPYAQVPTTLLAQVDSSVGGKTAVNHPQGKNLIGAFYQPEMVLIDIEVLKTLEPREVSAGLAEVVKYGVIHDYEFFCWLESHVQKLRERDAGALIHTIKRACQIKAEIVEKDEREGSIRAFLNYGHTFGHAIEKLSGYGQWKHGEAVSVGMVVAAKISAQQGFCSQQDVERLIHLLSTLELPIDPPDFSLSAYVEAMQRDKKVNKGSLSLVLNRGLGDVTLWKVTDIYSVFSSALDEV